MKTLKTRINKFLGLCKNSFNVQADSMGDALAHTVLNVLVAPICFVAIVILGWE